MLEAELKVSKEFIVKQERMYESLEQLKDQKDLKIDELRGKITELEIDASDKQREVERLLNREDQLESKSAELSQDLKT